MKKIILLWSSIIAVGTPLITTIACNKKSKIIIDNKKIQIEENENIYANKYYRPFQFGELKELGKGQSIMSNGIGYESYIQGMSFLFNVLRKIGFNMVDGEPKVINGHASEIKYHNEHTQQSILEKYPQEDPKAILKLFNKAHTKAIAKNGNYWNTWSLTLDPLGVDNAFKHWLAFAAGYLWKNYFYTNDVIKQKFIYDPQYKYKTSKDKIKFKIPFSQKILEYGIASYWIMIDGDNPQPQRPTIKTGAKIMLGLAVNNHDSLHIDWKTKLFQKRIQINKKWSFTYYLVSKKNWLQGYTVLKNQVKIDEIKMLITAIIKNLNYLLKNKNFQHPIIKHVHPDIKRAFDFIKNLDFKNDQALLGKINKAVEVLNNGTHNMFAIEIFARGIDNMPARYLPMGYGVKPMPKKQGTRHLVGMANSVDPKNILRWVSSTKAGYEDEKGKVSLQDREGFDPNTMTPFIGNDRIEGNAKKLKKDIKRVGREIKPMGGMVEKIIYKKWWQVYQDWQSKNKSQPGLVAPKLKFYDQKYLI